MKKRISFSGLCVLAVLLGLALGTWFGNRCGPEWLEQAGIYSDSYADWLLGEKAELRIRFLQILALRGLPFFLALAAGRRRILVLLPFLFWLCFSGSVYWTACLLRSGLAGGLVWGVSLFPHWIFYAGAYLRLFAYAKRRESVRRREALLPAAWMVLGAAAEASAHLWIMRRLLRL